MDVKEFDKMIIDEHEEFINKVVGDYMVFSKGRGNPKHVRKCIEDFVREDKFFIEVPIQKLIDTQSKWEAM